MTPVRCLYFEDDLGEFITIKQNLYLAWETVGKEDFVFAETGNSVGDINFFHLLTPEEAFSELSENGGSYHLLLQDLLGEDHRSGSIKVVGTNLANFARAKGLTLGIIGISGVGQNS